ncbi:A/G-specific adenine glycosylase [Ruminococcaceae bacterium OttesenSCG-928-N02]|nr:A/G-specific adenine glycosylase [Ruminococcaceae bacterium OttesenSCG-928-N02]
MPNLSPIAAPLCAWYVKNARALPWRESREPYHIWVSEIMLQQTRVAAVIPYYERFLSHLPTVQTLAHADEPLLLKLWEGLGYYSRVRNMQRAAQLICREHGGLFPRTAGALQKLPGIGPYTAAALASICFGEAVPAVDGNVLRVCTRLAASEADISLPKTKTLVASWLTPVMALADPGTLNQALMELGASACRPGPAPTCDVCPLAHLCASKARGLQAALPRKTRKNTRTLEEITFFIIVHEGRVALQKRPSKGLLAGLWEFPCATGTLSEVQSLSYLAQMGVQVLEIKTLAPSRHVFTHKEWLICAYIVKAGNWPTGSTLTLATPSEISAEYTLSSALTLYKGSWAEYL